MPPVISEPEEEPEPTPFVRDTLAEFVASLPDKLDVGRDSFEQFLLNLSMCHEPIAFELLGTHKKVITQFAASPHDGPLLSRQLQSFFPEAVFVPGNRVLEKAWEQKIGDEPLAVEFGLAREFMLPLASGKIDPFIGIVGALSALQPGEIGLFQVLFQPVSESWPENIVRSVTHSDGKPYFLNRPELAGAAEKKVARPLFAAVVRILVCAGAFDRSLQLAQDLAGSLSVFDHPNGNELIPLKNEGYHLAEHIEDVLARQTRRTGMILNSDELMGFVHIPTSAVRSPSFVRQAGKTKPAPSIVRQSTGILLGENEHAGETGTVRLTAEQRTRHAHVIGASGTGKSTLLFNLIRQDIENGEGVAILDPHGDLIDRICGIIPPERVDDVVLVDPSDPEYSVGFNILSAHSELEKNLLASDLVAVFERLSSSWGDQMNSVLQNAILAFLENDRPGTIADLRRFLIEKPFLNDFLKMVRDPEVVYYWQKSFPHLSGTKSIGSILTRLDTFLAKKPIRLMVSQPENKLDFANIMDSGKIFLAKLPEGLLGKENSHLLGTVLISKFQQIAMSRQAQQVSSRRDFWLYIDEFANFITPSMAEILSGARKYRLGLTLAHHELHQLDRNKEVASAVMSHPYTRVVFRVGDDDAKKLAEGFSYFEAKDLRNLPAGQAVCRVERSDFDFNLGVPLPEPVDVALAEARRAEVVTASRRKYAMARAEVEALLAKSRATTPKEQQSETAAPEPPLAKASVPPLPDALPTTPSDSLKVPEIPALTVSEKKISEPPATPPPVVAPPAITPSEPEPPKDLGKGGGQHKAIQQRIKKVAEGLGFRSIIEHPIAGSKESIDLFLKRGSQEIACEISISTTVDHEVLNAAKCLKAGIATVAMICVDEKQLQRIAAAVSGSLGPEVSARMVYFKPDPFIEYIKSLPAPLPKASEKTYAGYKVKHSLPKLSAEEQKAKEDLAHKLLSEALKKKKKK
ncbi:MAG TPA: type IV secretion system DNA-binding domain-containing protein [Candidatus Angelobacter sp.]|nr:type IV secretion system DNA-binding domain-containing protein [Candidatus Angelobacter sp.]